MENSQIEWLMTTLPDGSVIQGHTWNPWVGCTEYSPGCTNCYARTLMQDRFKRVKWGKNQERSKTSESYWRKPILWNRDCEQRNYRIRVFCASVSDWLDDEVPIEWLAELLLLIDATQNLDWLLVTKRPENWKPRLQAVIDYHLSIDQDSINLRTFAESWLNGEICPQNVWFGVTTEDQIRANYRIEIAMSIPAWVHFLSVEPILENIDLKLGQISDRICLDGSTHPGFAERHDDPTQCPTWYDWCNCRPDWVIVGGESGNAVRSCDLIWMRSIVAQCKAAGVPVFVKQLGSKVVSDDQSLIESSDRKGSQFNLFPADLQLREFPVPHEFLR